MPALTPAEIVTLRDQHPGAARTEWYLAVAPYGDACFTARVNDGAITRGAMTIAYDGDVGEANVSAGMTLWVGSTAGAHDIGMLRIRSINPVANTLGVAENDHIEWADDLYLTCPGEMGFREIWGVYQRMTEAAGVVSFYTDYDVAYNDPADDVLPPKANGGPPVCAWMDDAGNADVSFVGDRSYTTEIGAALSAYSWDFADGAVISGAANVAGTCAVPNVVRFTTPGFRYVSLTVTDNTAQARTAIVYIPVWIFQENVQEPFKKVEVLSQQGDQTGWRCKLRVFQTESTDEGILYHFPPGALVVLFTKTWYEGTETSVGGFCYRTNIRFVGWLANETLKFDYESGYIEFESIGNAMRMGSVPGFSFTLEDDATPSDWYEMNDLNVDRALHYLLHYHTTVNQVCHVERAGEGANRALKIQIFPDASTYSQAQDHMLKDAQCLLLADRQGILRATRDPQFMDGADRAGVDIVCDLVSTDWVNDVDVITPHAPKVGLVRLGGFHYATPLLSQAPGDAPRQQENDLRLDGCILQDQAEANLWSGLALTKANNEFPQVPLTLSGYWPVFDPAFQEYLRLTTTDPLGRNNWVDKKFIIRNVSFRDLPTASTTMTVLVLEAESDIQSGETVTVPDPPPPEPPPEPPGPPDLPPDPPWEGPVKACVGWTHDQLGYTPDLLLHHHHGVATAGTGLLALHDAAADFATLGVAIGDVVEELGTAPTPANITTVAAVVSATQLTLTADIGLVPTSEYHICGTQWVDVIGTIVGTILHFIYVRTGVSTVGAWVLTKTGVYYTANILTPSPVWSLKLTIAQVRTATGDTTATGAQFAAIHGFAAEPEYVIISIKHGQQGAVPWGFPGWAAYVGGYVHTHDLGANWTYANMPAAGGGLGDGNRATGYSLLEVCESTGKIWGMRSWGGTKSHTHYSLDLGGSFARYAEDQGTLDHSHFQEIYNPYSAGESVLYIDRGRFSSFHLKSVNSGANFTGMAAAGYTVGDAGKEGVDGWVYNANDVIMTWKSDADGFYYVLRSSDAGSTWAAVADIIALFGGEIAPGVFGALAKISDTWLPDEDVILLAGLQVGTVANTQICRIRYTQNNGSDWYNKMGNWLTVFGGSWDGGTPVAAGDHNEANVGCTPLPRVGANV